jgi:uncharacterized membrane protein
MARALKIEGNATDDPYMLQFDKGLALLSYGLLFISPFGIGVPAMASLALAMAHRGDAHPVTRSHYRFQSQVFWTAAALLVIGVALIVVGGGLEMTTVFGFIQERLSGFALPGWLVGGYADPTEREAGNWMLIGGLITLLVAVGWLMLASLWGALKLVFGRSMGERR